METGGDLDLAIEELERCGDILRHMGGKQGLAPTFTTTNRSKRSIVLDLQTREGLSIVERLVAGADVFVAGTAVRRLEADVFLETGRPFWRAFDLRLRSALSISVAFISLGPG